MRRAAARFAFRRARGRLLAAASPETGSDDADRSQGSEVRVTLALWRDDGRVLVPESGLEGAPWSAPICVGLQRRTESSFLS